MRTATVGTIAAMACMVTLAGCATSPIGVRRMDPDAVSRALTANALTENQPSIDTTNVLHRRGLYLKFQKHPAWTLAELHRLALLEDDDDTWFALAELSFLHADRTGDRKYSVMAAIYAWSFLFGGAPPEPFDPRLRVATDLYNRGLTQGLETSQKKGIVLAGSTTDLPIGQIVLDFDTSSLEWNGRHLHDFVPVAELQVNGLDNRFRSPGIGAPLAASATVANPDESSEFLAPRLRTPVTAVIRFEDIRRQVARGKIRATLELHTDPNEESITIQGRRVPLEREPTAALAAMLAEAPVIKQEIYAFLGTLTQGQGKGRLAALRPHVSGRIPVVFVHGTASSPARWAEMINVLDNDPRINRRFEPWFFAYNSSSPIIYSSYLLRRAMKDAVEMLDPEGTDPGLREMVVIGHSQGGLLTKMTAVHSGDGFWRGISPKSFDELKLEDDKREMLREVMFVEPLPFVSRVVFICTPHGGSYLAASDWVRGLITRLVRLPVTVTAVTGNLLTLNPDLVHLQTLRRVNAVDNMTPGNRFVQALSKLPVAPGVASHSIIAVQTKGPLEDGNDGVVEYSSAHIEGVESEKVVHSSHSTQALPDTIEEVRRILLEHAATHEVPVAADEEQIPTAAAKASNAGRPALDAFAAAP
ncbi:MAG: esterase/lipase family protein [Candidatus Binatia bacterium]